MTTMATTSLLTIEAVRDKTATIAQFRAALGTHHELIHNRPYVEGDHWQNGHGWNGPMPMNSDPDHRAILAMIHKGFVSRNVILEILERLVSAVVGREPRWTWAPVRPLAAGEEPTAEEQTLITEVTAAQTVWWNKRQIHRHLKTLLMRVAWGQRCAWRAYFPGEEGTVSRPTFAEALDTLHVEIPEPECAAVWTDPVTQDRVGIVLWKDPVKSIEYAEVCYLDENGKTIVRTLDGESEQKPDPKDAPQDAANDYQQGLPIFMAELDRPRITEHLRAMNRSLNLTLTMLRQVLVDAAFMERTYMNALPPGEWEYAAEPNEAGERVKIGYKKYKLPLGGSRSTFLQGIDYNSEPGKTTITTPSVTYRDPTDPSGVIKGADYWYGAMLDEARQSHVIVNQASAVGFKSREQARGDFIDSTLDPQAQMETAGAELLRMIVVMAEVVWNKPGHYSTTLAPVFKCRPQYGPLSTAERKQNIDEAAAGYMADETAMALNGIDDTAAEQSLIQAQPRAALKLTTDQALAVQAWVDAGFTHEVGLMMIGLDDAEIAKIVKKNADTQPADPNPAPVDPGVKKPVAPVVKPV